jgi:4-hydroxyphenylpyruvate dioxygenase
MSDVRAPGGLASPGTREGVGSEIEGNPAGFDGIEFIEYSTRQPQALGQVLELIGFRPIARHRSREVLLYRQGSMNIVINAHGLAKPIDEEMETPSIAAVAFRVRDAAAAYRRAVELGAWPVATHVEVMELNIPAIHGVGATRIYLVDRYREFSIYSVDFVPIPDVDPALPDEVRFGILPKGRILKSPCANVYLQLVAPEPGTPDLYGAERLQRIGLGTSSVSEAVRALRERGVEFYVSENVHIDEKGALTRAWLGGVMFELVRDPPPGPAG